MKHNLKFILTLSIPLILTINCQRQSAPNDVALASLELLRGDITLCGTDQFGEVSFAINCEPPAREAFNLAISLLHSFEYDEAEKAFVKVMDIDPRCAMAYWGVAMANFHALWLQSGTGYLEKGSKILSIAQTLSLSEKETDYLDAIGAFYQNWESADHKTRVQRFEQKMEAVYQKYREDNEAAIFYALALTAAADPADKTYTNQIKSGRILESIFPEQPNHPGIAHYLIHNYDYPELAERALSTARSYANIAPASAHAQHMPSHIFTRLGLWDESIDSNLNSTAAAVCYAERIDPQAHWDEELHGMDYLVYAYLQIGDNTRAQEQYEYLKSFRKVFPVNFKIAYTAAAIPARIALENKNWVAAAQLELPPVEINWADYPWQKAILHFARALGSARSGDIAASERELDHLHSLHQELLEMGDDYKANQVHIQIKSVSAWISLARGNKDEAVALMEEAVTMENNTAKHPVTPGEVLPAGELLGDLFMALNQPEKALQAYESDLNLHPNRFNGLYGAAKAAKALGNDQKAVRYFQTLLDLAVQSHSDRPEIKEASEFIGLSREA